MALGAGLGVRRAGLGLRPCGLGLVRPWRGALVRPHRQGRCLRRLVYLLGGLWLCYLGLGQAVYAYGLAVPMALLVAVLGLGLVCRAAAKPRGFQP